MWMCVGNKEELLCLGMLGVLNVWLSVLILTLVIKVAIPVWVYVLKDKIFLHNHIPDFVSVWDFVESTMTNNCSLITETGSVLRNVLKEHGLILMLRSVFKLVL